MFSTMSMTMMLWLGLKALSIFFSQSKSKLSSIFLLVWNQNYTRDNTCFKLIMDQNLGQNYSNKSQANVKLPFRETNNGKQSNKCSQCGYPSSHLKIHRGEKSNKCTQCDYASSQAGDLRKSMKTHRRKVKEMQSMWFCIIWSR